MAQDDLKSRDIYDAATKASISPPKDNKFQIDFIGCSLFVDIENGEISAEDGSEVDISEKILLLHYINRADGSPPANRWIAFAELEDGRVYQDAFKGRAEGRLAWMCDKGPEAWLEAVERLGGKREALGDASASMLALPQVPIFMVYWAGEEEIPSAGKILFDANINGYLCTEDVAVLCDIALGRISKELKREK